MSFGFSKDQQDYFSENLVKPLKAVNACIWVFGSRARGDAHKFSDIDVLVAPKTVEVENLVREIRETFEEGNFPFKLDLVFDGDLATSYRPSVDKDKVEICALIPQGINYIEK